ncbi:MAG TPA: 2-dehydropantoate 2-reductase [Ktedonobacterales bacterium]|jgi:2-dehydropantoate 2-reductase|nr:2-dehydropantoate 2-reductase [Ktedonobacterales bacterium]
MRIAVVAAGAVGAYFGGRLARAGEDVVFVARGANLRALRESGLRVDSADGDFVVNPVWVTGDPATIGPVNAVLLAVKAWQVPEAIETMRPLVGPDTVVVPLLNGVEAADQVAAEFGARRVAGGLCGVFGSTVEPGHFRNVFPQPFITFGELDNTRSERLMRLQRAFASAGVQSTIAADIRAAIWEKLLFVGPFGGIGAVTRAPVGVIRSVPEARALLEGAMTEIFQVGRARGVAIADDAVANALAMIDGSPPQGTASMQRDIMAGRPSELESQVGDIVRMGRDAGVEVPIHTCLYASLLPQERQARGELVYPA